MWNEPTKERLEKMPKLYETEGIPLKDKLVYLHFFIGGSDWYAVEYDGNDTFFGFVILNNDMQMAEWGYFSFSELKSLNVNGWLEVDSEKEEFWDVKKAWPLTGSRNYLDKRIKVFQGNLHVSHNRFVEDDLSMMFLLICFSMGDTHESAKALIKRS